jgi:hypothetical protein
MKKILIFLGIDQYFENFYIILKKYKSFSKYR